MRYYLATASDGTVLTRSSQNRTYTHCVAAKRTVRAATPEEIEEGKRHCWFRPEAYDYWLDSWAGRLDLAHKVRFPDVNSPRVTCRVEILEAVEIDRRTYDAAKKAAREIQAA